MEIPVGFPEDWVTSSLSCCLRWSVRRNPHDKTPATTKFLPSYGVLSKAVLSVPLSADLSRRRRSTVDVLVNFVKYNNNNNNNNSDSSSTVVVVVVSSSSSHIYKAP